MVKTKLCEHIDRQSAELLALADKICDNPEIGLSEHLACDWLCDYLRKYEFSVQKGVGGLATSFRAEFSSGEDGISIGLLCEYDALEEIGHGCGHHLQGPSICGAAAALKEVVGSHHPYSVIVYGTPAEETVGGKIIMLRNGCFQDIDVALMMHASSSGTSVDNTTLAMSSFEVCFQGRAAHAAIAPEQGRSALDALLLSFSGMEFLREHVQSDVRMHYTISGNTGPVNVVHPHCSAIFSLRAYRRETLNEVISRFEDIIRGAALMSGTTFKITQKTSYDNAIPVHRLREVLMKNAKKLGTPQIRPPREKTGSTDFGNVSNLIPGACIRVASDGDQKVPGHSKEAANLGKSRENHEALLFGSKILATTSYDIISELGLLDEINAEFLNNKDGE